MRIILGFIAGLLLSNACLAQPNVDGFYILNDTNESGIQVSGNSFYVASLDAHRIQEINYESVRKACMAQPRKSCVLDIKNGTQLGKLYLDTDEMKVTKVEYFHFKIIKNDSGNIIMQKGSK